MRILSFAAYKGHLLPVSDTSIHLQSFHHTRLFQHSFINVQAIHHSAPQFNQRTSTRKESVSSAYVFCLHTKALRRVQPGSVDWQLSAAPAAGQQQPNITQATFCMMGQRGRSDEEIMLFFKVFPCNKVSDAQVVVSGMYCLALFVWHWSPWSLTSVSHSRILHDMVAGVQSRLCSMFQHSPRRQGEEEVPAAAQLQRKDVP